MEWRFVCRTGIPIVATFDGAILEVEIDDAAATEIVSDEADEWDADEALDETYALISNGGVGRTHCASEAVARRELRLLGAAV